MPSASAELTGGVELGNRAVCKQNEQSVYMMQTMIPIGGLVDGVNERFCNETGCFQREGSSQYIARIKNSTGVQPLVHSLGL